ncbi:MAG: LamG-like jellyroll fold domain-containing protein [Verrucomicrobiota bacterium JB023]|nr:LamG-like jellyroll fold domain-containing protein [Verrucomicrobiota bacterium JB023]
MKTHIFLLVSLTMLTGMIRAETTPVGPFFNGVFPSVTPGTGSGYTTENAFPNLRFIGPIWVTPYPGRNELVVVGKAGHVWRFENDPAVTSDEVTVMLNLSKYGDGVASPEEVLPDGEHEPSVVRTGTVVSAPDMAFYQIIFHPNFGIEGETGENHIYATYSYIPDLPGRSGDTYTYCRLSRFTIIDDESDGPIIDPDSELVLINQFDADRNHQGGAMFFGEDGFLYISTGDGGYAYSNNRLSQRLDRALAGGILRIDVDKRGGEISHPIRRHPTDSGLAHTGDIPSGWPASSSANYYIPSDNPWVDDDPESTILEEFWAIGLRSPHAMHRDEQSGEIWIGDVGGSQEEIHKGEQGANFGWDFTNGGGKSRPDPLIGFESPAVVTIPANEGNCIIGGFIYRGSEFPELSGKYLYGDHLKGTISTMTYSADTGEAETAYLCDFSSIGFKVGLANFCQGPNGEVFMPELGGFDDDTDIEDNDGTIQRLAPTSVSSDAPALLSQTGAFLDLDKLTPHPSFLPYGVLSPLWSDGADKWRWIAVPNNGVHDTESEKIVFDESGNWVFPEGTVLMKHFELATDSTQPEERVRLETRFLVCTADGGKYGITYRWLPDQTDAVLLTSGETEDFTVRGDSGQSQTLTWTYPSRGDCLQCHNSASGQALGVRTHQLNGYFNYGDGPVHQLVHWSHLGLIDASIGMEEAALLPQAAPLDDETVPLQYRIRSYLDTNCSICHQPGGPGGNFDSRLSTPLLAQGLLNVEPERFQDLGPDATYLKPGDAARSIIHYRMDHALPAEAAMPPLAKALVDEAAVSLVEEWIDEMTPADYSESATHFVTHLDGPTNVTGDFFANLTLDDDVSSVEASHFTLTGGSILNITGNAQNFTIKVRPSSNDLTFGLKSDVVTGAFSNLPNKASNQLQVSYSDDDSPSPFFSGIPSDGLFSDKLTLSLGFGKQTSAPKSDDFIVSNGSIGSISAVEGQFIFDLNAALPGEVILSLREDAVTDSSGRGHERVTLTLNALPIDSDGDGLDDEAEALAGTNSDDPDSDNDGLLDGLEVNSYGTNPLSVDSDGDNFSDAAEIFAGSDPNAATSVPPSVYPASLLAYYPFDEGEGETAFDLAEDDGTQDAYRNQGSGNFWTTSQQLIGSAALELDGSSSLSAGEALTDGSSQAFTMSVWVNPSSVGGYKGIYSGRNNPGNWGLNIDNGIFEARFENAGRTSSFPIEATEPLLADEPKNGGWYHLAITYETDGEDALATAFLNGVPFASTEDVSPVYDSPDKGYTIGDDPCCADREFKGLIDDLAIFEEALNEASIANIYQAGLQGLPVVSAIVDSPLQITGLDEQPESNHLIVTWASEPGAVYSLLTSTDLKTWTTLYDAIPSSGLETEFDTRLILGENGGDFRLFAVQRNGIVESDQ